MIGTRRSGIRILAAFGALTLLALAASPGFSAGPAFMPGFPLRAGANVMLMWLPGPGATSYAVYRAEKPGGPYEKIGSPAANNFMDLNVPLAKTYYYIVKQVVGGKEGDASAEVVIKGIEPMVSPKFAGHLITDDNKLSLRWETNAKAAFYNLYRSEQEKGEYKLLTSIQDNKYTDGDVAVGKKYYYRVTAVSSDNMESPKEQSAFSIKIEKKVAAVEEKVKLIPLEVQKIDVFDVDGTIALREPKDIAVDGEGGFFVVDGLGGVYHVNKGLKIIRKFEKPADDKGQWGRAQGVFFDRKGRTLYITSTDTNYVRLFRESGDRIAEFRLSKPDPKVAPNQGWNPAPVDCALGTDGTLWVLDGNYYQMIGLNARGEEVRRASLPRDNPDREKQDEDLMTPAFVEVNPKTGSIYVMEIMMQRITMYDKDGKFVKRIGGRGGQPGRFIQPSGLSVDETGRLYAGDRNMNRIQLFDPEGKYIATLVDPKEPDPTKKEWVAPTVSGIAAGNGMVYTGDLMKERVLIYRMAK